MSRVYPENSFRKCSQRHTVQFMGLILANILQFYTHTRKHPKAHAYARPCSREERITVETSKYFGMSYIWAACRTTHCMWRNARRGWIICLRRVTRGNLSVSVRICIYIILRNKCVGIVLKSLKWEKTHSIFPLFLFFVNISTANVFLFSLGKWFCFIWISILSTSKTW